VAGLAVGLAVESASGMIPFRDVFLKTYVGDGKTPQQAELGKAVATAKCNVCHDAASTSKKDHNPYGMSLKKLGLKKSEKNKEKIAEFLKKAEGEKNGSGKSYGDLIKAGKLPYEAK
jgi:hypothetical protein